MNLDLIKNNTKWEEAANSINSNFNKTNLELTKIAASSVKHKGYFTTEAALLAAQPSPKVGDNAYVGATYPGVVYICNTAGMWTATTTVPSPPAVNISEYYKKTETDAIVATVESNITSLESDLNYMNGYYDTEKSDLEICDEYGNVLVEFSNGNILSKNFDSSTMRVSDELDTDFSIEDEIGNNVVKFKRGHIITEKFNSKDLLHDVYTNYIKLIRSHSALLNLSVEDNLNDIDLSIFNINTWESRKNTLNQVYSAFDTLVANNPVNAERIDVSSVTGISYPVYANGITAEGDYAITPYYRTYCYRLHIDSPDQTFSPLGINKKRTMLLYSGEHGNEYVGPITLYYLAKQLLDGTDPNLFSILSVYDIYIIPCLNGYGMYHASRVNANGVNINRNYPTSKWKLDGTPGDFNYTGPYGGSEFETKLIMAYYYQIRPTIVIDYHNGSTEVSSQFGMFHFRDADMFLGINMSTVANCSHTLCKHYPQYFGKLNLNAVQFTNASYNSMNSGQSHAWFNERGVYLASIPEGNDSILYQNGAIYNTGISFSEDVFKINEYCIRTLLINIVKVDITRVLEYK